MLAQILACHVRREVMGEDHCLWKLNVNGSFIVKTAYTSITLESDLVADGNWIKSGNLLSLPALSIFFGLPNFKGCSQILRELGGV